MPIEIKMPALSPTMEEGTLAKWLVKEGDHVKSGDLLAEIETDKATMEFEAVDEGVIGTLLVAEGADNVKVGTVIATLVEDGEAATPAPKPAAKAEATPVASEEKPVATPASAPVAAPVPAAPADSGDRVKASPLARRIAADRGVDLAGLAGSGPGGRIVKADIESGTPASRAAPASAPSPAVAPAPAGAKPVAPVANVVYDDSIPHSVVKLSGMRKVIARRLTEAKATIPHIYLTVDVRLDALLALRVELNKVLEGRGVKLSVNDLLVKALGVALMRVPACNVTFAGDTLVQYERVDVSVAVSIPGGLITPIVRDVANKSIAAIATETKDLATRAKEGKLKPEEYQGGTASISNMGMMGIKQFDAVINPPQAMILAIGAGEARPYVVGGKLDIATVMSATGSFDHRAVDGSDGALLMKTFKELVEAPLGLMA